MIAVLVDFEIAADMVDDFLKLMHQQAENSLALEDGCFQFDVCSGSANPTTVFLYELYDSKAAFDVHLASAHFKAFDAAVSSMVTGKSVRILDIVMHAADI